MVSAITLFRVAIRVAMGTANPLSTMPADVPRGPLARGTDGALTALPPSRAQFMKDGYPDSKSDLFAGFIERCTNLIGPRGIVAMITMQSWMFLSSYQKLRASLLTKQHIASMLHLGTRAFDSIGGEVVSSAAFVLAKAPTESQDSARKRAGAFVRLVDGGSEAEKATSLRAALASRTGEAGFFAASSADFTAIPGFPIIYWLSEKMRTAFSSGKRLGEISTPLVGLRTGDNNRFMRKWWEVSNVRSALACESLQAAEATGAKWFPYNKGGAFRRWYGNHEYVVDWEQDGKEIEEGLAKRYPYLVPAGKKVVRGQGRDRYFSPSVSWSKISSGTPSFRAYPHGFIFDVAGTSMFAETQSVRDALIAFTNSQVAYEQLSAVAPTMNFEVGQVAGLPVVEGMTAETSDRAEALVERAKADWDAFEPSWNFTENPLVRAFQGA
ncbi:hypothetical protein C0Z11_09865 [Acidipropionibacterium jensenii]|uniref:Eco57I restriction-modification methylase domain-containing protein n=1 Tax=Acidipropionibacterium jensenii TaxID=1749 RepID=UPI000BEF1A65|nr:hypothetical protein [Acidipropionibacterium jensenii]AZZ42533.1 hypothetical protein C0Z11_09865 [Acidipropionibacterium jensenii]